MILKIKPRQHILTFSLVLSPGCFGSEIFDKILSAKNIDSFSHLKNTALDTFEHIFEQYIL